MSRKKTTKLYTKDDCSAWVFAAYVDARSGVEFQMMLDRHFVRRSGRGLPWECLLALAIQHAAKEDPSIFPHPVKNAYVIGCTVYIIDQHPKRGNQLVHCVRYQHNFTRKLRKFDNFSKRTFLRHFGDEGVHVVLRPPRKDSNANRVHGTRNAAPSREDGSRRRILHGAERRAADAGIITPAAAA